MAERDNVAALVDRVVAGARIPTAARRADLRRELLAHFEDAGASPEALQDALDRFGPTVVVAESLRRVYRQDYLLAYLAKIAASLAASIITALLIEVLVHVRVEGQAAWRLAPGFWYGATLAIGVVLALAAAWEICRRPFSPLRAVVAGVAYGAAWVAVPLLFGQGEGVLTEATLLVGLGAVCSRFDPRPVKLTLTFAVFAAALYGLHVVAGVAFSPARALSAGAVLIAVWSATVVIMASVDHAFVNLCDAAGGGRR